MNTSKFDAVEIMRACGIPDDMNPFIEREITPEEREKVEQYNKCIGDVFSKIIEKGIKELRRIIDVYNRSKDK